MRHQLTDFSSLARFCIWLGNDLLGHQSTNSDWRLSLSRFIISPWSPVSHALPANSLGMGFQRSGQHRSNNLTPVLRGVPARLCLLCTGLPSCVLSLKMFFKSTGNKEGNLAARGSSLETGPMHKTLARLPSNRPRFTLQLRSLRPSYKPLKTSAPLWYSRIHTSPWGSREDFKKKRESRRVSPVFMRY